jgi:hypothetical protein
MNTKKMSKPKLFKQWVLTQPDKIPQYKILEIINEIWNV